MTSLHAREFVPVRVLARLAAALVCGSFVARPARAQSNPWSTGTGGTIYYNGGNVGIGTTNPGYELDIYGGNAQMRLNALNASRFIFSSGSHNFGLGSNYYVASAFDIRNETTGADVLTILNAGNVGIGTTNPQYLLSVNGTIGTKDIIVTNTGWSDYVFRPGYRLRPLSEVGAYIRAHHHLPDIPTEAEVKEKGVSMAGMQAKLLAKIEELTLHLIEMEHQNRELRERIDRLEGEAGGGGRKAPAADVQ